MKHLRICSLTQVTTSVYTLGNEDVGIHERCMELVIGRAQLYKKFNSLTNVPLGKLFRSFRLHKARDLLQSTTFNVSDAVYRVGSKNLSHFSNFFQKELGMNPSDLKS